MKTDVIGPLNVQSRIYNMALFNFYMSVVGNGMVKHFRIPLATGEDPGVLLNSRLPFWPLFPKFSYSCVKALMSLSDQNLFYFFDFFIKIELAYFLFLFFVFYSKYSQPSLSRCP